MKTKLGDIVRNINAFTFIGEAYLPGPIAFDAISVMEAVQSQLDRYGKARDKIIEEYGEEQNGSKKLTPSSNPKAFQELDELMDKEIELPDFKMGTKEFENALMRLEGARAADLMYLKKNFVREETDESENEK